MRDEHRGHATRADCYRAVWREIPLPWVKRDQRSPRSWHLAIGVRLDSGAVQTWCNVGGGGGPFIWRALPTLDWKEEPGEWFCRRCVAHWTERLRDVTVRSEDIRLSLIQWHLLEGRLPTEFDYISLRATAIEDAPAIIAEIHCEDSLTRYLLGTGGILEL